MLDVGGGVMTTPAKKANKPIQRPERRTLLSNGSRGHQTSGSKVLDLKA